MGIIKKSKKKSKKKQKIDALVREDYYSSFLPTDQGVTEINKVPDNQNFYVGDVGSGAGLSDPIIDIGSSGLFINFVEIFANNTVPQVYNSNVSLHLGRKSGVGFAVLSTPEIIFPVKMLSNESFKYQFAFNPPVEVRRKITSVATYSIIFLINNLNNDTASANISCFVK